MSTLLAPITIELGTQDHRLAIESMLHAYLSELGASTECPYLDLYWRENARFPYLIRVGSDLAGFALARKNERDRFEIAEFCVFAHFRRVGAGSAAAAKLFIEDGVPVFHFSVPDSILSAQHRDANSLHPGLQR